MFPQQGGQIFGVAPTPQQPDETTVFGGFKQGFFDNMFAGNQAPSAPVASTPHDHGPLGSIAAFKGDLLYPVFNVGFFIVGVVLVVKLIWFLLALVKVKLAKKLTKLLAKTGLVLGRNPLSAKDVVESLDDDEDDSGDLFRRRRRSIRQQEKLDSLTSLVMTALESQQCIQRMTCELGSFIQKYDTGNYIVGIAERIAPDEFMDKVEALKKAGNCSEYQCGRTLSVEKNLAQAEDVKNPV